MRPRGLGCMRLSTAADRDEERAVEVLHAALDGSIELFDENHEAFFGAPRT